VRSGWGGVGSKNEMPERMGLGGRGGRYREEGEGVMAGMGRGIWDE